MSKDSKLSRVKQQLIKQPNLTADLVMKHLGVSKVYAYNLLSTARKSLGMVKHRGKWALKMRMQATPRDEAAMKLLTVMSSNESVKEKLAEQAEMLKDFIAPRIVETHHTDNVNHPAHYKVGGVETIDFIEAKGLNYNLSNVVKYITRAGHKDDLREDLLKARWYLEREIAKTVKE
jgi:acetolactate synthase regulatory subunit